MPTHALSVTSTPAPRATRLVAWAGLFVGVAASGCDSGPAVTPASTFDSEDPYARQIEGRVLYGTESASSAAVHIDASLGLAHDAALEALRDPTWTTATDPGGKYHIKSAPFRYDLSVHTDREIASWRGVTVRFFQLPLGPQAEPTGFSARVAVSVSPPPHPGNAHALFVSGADARAVSGDTTSARVLFRTFDATVTLYVVEYSVANGLAAAVNEGRTELKVRDGVIVPAHVDVVPVKTSNDVTFVATPPPGFSLAALEVSMDQGLLTSANVVGHGAPGVPFTIAIVPGARYAVRARATRGGAVVDSGLSFFDPTQKVVPITLTPPLSTESPFDDAAPAPSGDVTLAPDGVLSARLPATSGVIEHVLVPRAGGPTLRVATIDRQVTLPDVTVFGLPRITGTYAWSVRHFPTLKRIDDLGGEDVRVVPPSSVTAERTIVVR